MPDEAEPVLRRTVELRRTHLGDDAPSTINEIHSLAWNRWKQGDLAEADTLFREAIERSRRVNGEEHDDTKFYQKHYDQMKAEIANAPANDP